MGQFECFWKDDWDAGLLKLAKSGDAKLQEAAKKDLANPDDPTEQVTLGDAWWKVAEAEAEPLQGAHQTTRRRLVSPQHCRN